MTRMTQHPGSRKPPEPSGPDFYEQAAKASWVAPLTDQGVALIGARVSGVGGERGAAFPDRPGGIVRGRREDTPSGPHRAAAR